MVCGVDLDANGHAIVSSMEVCRDRTYRFADDAKSAAVEKPKRLTIAFNWHTGNDTRSRRLEHLYRHPLDQLLVLPAAQRNSGRRCAQG